MSITAWDIKEAAFSSDVKDVEELILTNKGATDVGALSQAVNLRSLSLAFNSLASLSGLAPLVRLQSLNVSHNQLASLKGLHSLSCLVTLNASHNKVVSLAPLSGLSALADLWLQNNSIAAPGELRVLGGLPGLQRLAIANNPVSKALPADHVRLVALRLCPGLRVIDGRPVEEAERAASEQLDLEALLSSRPPAPGSAPAAGMTHGSFGSLGGRPGSAERSPAVSGDGGGSSRARGSAGLTRSAGRPGGRSANGSAYGNGSGNGNGTPESRLPAASARRRPRSYDSNLHAAEDVSGADPAGPGGGTSGTAAPGGDLDDAVATALEAVASFSSSTSSIRSPGGSGIRIARSGSGSSRRPPLPGGRPATQLQAGSQFQAVLDALPRFDSSKLPTRYGGPPPKSRAQPPPAPAKPPPDAHLVEYEARYPANRGGGRAVVVRRDGSAAAFWPGGDMAVTIDADYSAVASPSAASSDEGGDDDGGDGGGAAAAAVVEAGGLPYKMMVMYRAGGVAVSWDAVGGFVQYPNGGLMLMYSRTTGSGTCYNPSGEITRRWRDTDAPAGSAPPVPAIALPLALAAAATPRPPPPPPPSHIDMQLDPHLGIRFHGPSRILELYLSCESVRYRFRCGRNTPGEVWEPPPGRGDSAAGSLAASRTSPPAAYDSLPSTPGGSGRWPYLGEGGGVDGGVGADGEAGLPPPSFLRNLARQGGAGTHRSVAGGSGGGGGGGGGAGGSGGSSKAEATGLDGIASITAGLQALDEGLQAWLKRDSTATSSTTGKAASSTAADDQSREPPSPLSATAGATPPRKPQAQAAPGPTAASRPGRRTGVGSGVSAARALAAEASSAAEACTTPAAASSSAAPEAGALAGGAPGAPGAGAEADEGAGGGEGGSGARVGIDSDVAAHLAAARKLAADSLAAAMAAASAIAAIGSVSS